MSGGNVKLSIHCSKLKRPDGTPVRAAQLGLYADRQRVGNWQPLAYSEVLENTAEPKFERTFLLEFHLEKVQALKCIVYDITDPDRAREEHLASLLETQPRFGEASFTLSQIVGAPDHLTVLPLTHSQHPTLALGETHVRFEDYIAPASRRTMELTPRTSVLELLFKGLQVGLTVAVDMTLSNKTSATTTLHTLDPFEQNDYLDTFRAFYEILGAFNEKRLIHAYGFGARAPPHFDSATCFPLSLAASADAVGEAAFIEQYRAALATAEMHQCSTLADVVHAARRHASEPWDNSRLHYDVLLVLTDGVVSDRGQQRNVEETREELVRAATEPLSVVMVGIGAENFDNMALIDGSTPLVSIAGRPIIRDCTQFLLKRAYRSHHISKLVEDALERVAVQMAGWFDRALQQDAAASGGR